MNKRKLAVFVEGQTELVFVREFLKQWYAYDASIIGFSCFNLQNNEYRDVAYQYGDEDSENYFMLVNVGNDNSVLSKILSRLTFLYRQGYQLVIGLRDMYSAQYIKDAGGHTIDEAVCQNHSDAVREVLMNISHGEIVDFHFAIMEVEAWLLGMHDYLLSIDERLTIEFIKESTGVDLDNDPEKTIVHPAMELNRIYGLVGKKYDKHLSDISSIMTKLKNRDFVNLIESGKCSTFKLFVESLLGTPEGRR
ncbi:MAG: hypothetical protein K6A96_07830 [Prevotella sp.]|nr:hypothetical protein [Prevotella sp.]